MKFKNVEISDLINASYGAVAKSHSTPLEDSGGLAESTLTPLHLVLDNLNYKIQLPATILGYIFYDYNGKFSFPLYRKLARRAFALGVDANSFFKMGSKCIISENEPTTAAVYITMLKEFINKYYAENTRYISFKNLSLYVNNQDGIRSIPTVIGLYFYMNERIGNSSSPLSCNQIAKTFHISGNDGNDNNKGNGKANDIINALTNMGFIELVEKGCPRTAGETVKASTYRLTRNVYKVFDSMYSQQVNNYMMFDISYLDKVYDEGIDNLINGVN